MRRVVALFAAAELVRPAALDRREAARALVIAALCGLATMATPYGWGAIRYLFENLSVPSMFEIAELAPPYLPGYRAFYVYLVVWAVILLSQPKQLRLWEVVVGAAAAALGLRFLRLTPLLVIVTAPMLASRAAVFIAHGLDARAILATTLVAVALVSRIPLTTLASTWRIGGDAIAPPAFFSTRAVDFARAEGLDGPLFNSNNLGGFLAWSLFPPPRIFQDSRLQAYPREHWIAIQRAERSPADWDRLVAPVDWAMLSIARPGPLSGVGRFPRGDVVHRVLGRRRGGRGATHRSARRSRSRARVHDPDARDERDRAGTQSRDRPPRSIAARGRAECDRQSRGVHAGGGVVSSGGRRCVCAPRSPGAPATKPRGRGTASEGCATRR